MALSTDTLTLHEARRIALHAQGFADPRPNGRVDRRHFRRVLDRVGLVQIDSVNVLTRSHELPFLARLGPYPRQALASWLWQSGEVFEYWGHEASLLPVELHPSLRWRMQGDHQWYDMATFELDHPDLAQRILEAVAEQGPVPVGRLGHLGEAVRRSKPSPGNMWNWSPAKRAVEWLFWTGQVGAVRNPASFERSYALPELLLPRSVLEAPRPADDDARKDLLVRAARSHGVGTARDLADYYRVNIRVARRLLVELTADGALRPVQVEGWREPAYLHPDAMLPRSVRTSALLSPFDSLVWERSRTEALFGFRYRTEIYVPAPKRVHGYYVLPYLHRGELVARVDLKADRATGRLLVQGAHGETAIDRAEVADGLADQLVALAGFLGLDAVAVHPNGDLAGPLAAALP